MILLGPATQPLSHSAIQPSSHSATQPRIVVILLDRLDLPDLLNAEAPALRKLMARGAVGLVAPKMAGDLCSANAYATLFAGAPIASSQRVPHPDLLEELARPLQSAMGQRDDPLVVLDLADLGLDDRGRQIPVTISTLAASSVSVYVSSRWIEARPTPVSPELRRRRLALWEAFAATARPQEIIYLFACLTSRNPKRYFPRLTPILMVGPGIEPGLLTTPTTRQHGLVTLSDVAPTILRLLDQPIPSSMTGRALTVVPSSDPIYELRHLDNWTRHRDAVAEPAVTLIATIPGIVGIVVILMLLRAPSPPSLLPKGEGGFARTDSQRLACDFALLFGLAMPLSALIVSPFLTRGPWVVYGGLLIISALVAGRIQQMSESAANALIVLSGIIAGLITLDALLGGPWTTWSLMGNSFTTGGRFYGVENGHVAYLIAYTLVVLGLALQRPHWLAVVVAATLPLLIGLRWFGANFGGTIALAAALWTFVLARSRARFGRRELALVVAATLAQTALVVIVDLAFRSESQSHLGLAFAQPSSLMETALRKWRANLGYFAVTPFNYVTVAIALVFTSFVRWRPARLERICTHWPGVPALLSAGAVGIWTALLANDSGIVMLDQMIQVLVPALLLLALYESNHPATQPPSNSATSS